MDFIWATGATGLTVNAEPNGTAFKNLFFLPHLDHPDDAVRPDIHIRGSGATGRAFKALVAEVQFFSARSLNFLQEGGTLFLYMGCRFQFYYLHKDRSRVFEPCIIFLKIFCGTCHVLCKRLHHPKGLDG